MRVVISRSAGPARCGRSAARASLPHLDLTAGWSRRGCGLGSARTVRDCPLSLLARVVKPRAVVEDDFTVVDASRRNCVFLATTRAATYVVKQAPPAQRRHAGTRSDHPPLLAAAPELGRRVPAVVHEEPDAARSSCERPPAARLEESTRPISSRPARVLGRVLAVLHGSRGASRAGDGPERAWARSPCRAAAELLLDLSPVAQDLGGPASRRATSLCEAAPSGLREPSPPMRSYTATCAGTTAWRSRRRAVGAGPACCSSTGSSRARAPAFDAGTVLAEYLHAWVGSIPIVAAGDPGRLVLGSCTLRACTPPMTRSGRPSTP